MADRTVEALNRMIDTAGRDDLIVVSTGGTSAAEKIVTMLDAVTRESREVLPTGAWGAEDEAHAAAWLALDGVLKRARKILRDERQVGA